MSNVIDFKTPLEIHEVGVKKAEEAVEKWLEHWLMSNPEAFQKYGEPLYCGFAWVNIRPATTKFARALRKAGIVNHRSHLGGYDIWNPAGYNGQSMDVKEEGARAYARVLTNYGIKATSITRPD